MKKLLAILGFAAFVALLVGWAKLAVRLAPPRVVEAPPRIVEKRIACPAPPACDEIIHHPPGITSCECTSDTDEQHGLVSTSHWYFRCP